MSTLEPKMGKRRRDENGKVIYDRPSDLKDTRGSRPNRNRYARDNGSENKKTVQKRTWCDDTFALVLAPELGLRKCINAPHVTSQSKSLHSRCRRQPQSRSRTRAAPPVRMRLQPAAWLVAGLLSCSREKGFALFNISRRSTPISLAPKDTKIILLHALKPVRKKLLDFKTLVVNWKRRL